MNLIQHPSLMSLMPGNHRLNHNIPVSQLAVFNNGRTPVVRC
jgi:hypothetical protein